MASKRMFSVEIVRSDAFLTMPISSRLLYYDLSMDADDDGFVDKPYSIIRMTGASNDDLKLLIAKSFIIPFDSEIIVIKHWRINNYIRGDRYKPTNYLEEKSQLSIKKNNSYTLKKDVGIPVGIPLVDVDKSSIDKYSIDKINILLEHDEVYIITDGLITQFKQTYKNISIDDELIKIQTWCIANPSKRKTKCGALRFINSWLNRANENAVKEVSKNAKGKYECNINFPDER